ncbi:protein of unknown function [Taphrina deformans PYCC 5710]|uniref:Cardiolipin synthase N-terminal domain-containing protein n=1 Tax=Taphrina deformans (strain PYCC 5710 / ATCC 11124 / CBS 356.35 / IMI 108563 / JCM 9778 / NBRC 8474) TaxID=1097556 RepID=R4XJ83_TAPDE|nr:protein of unknown function [Taphrina deformans PYCC 5710]|eukprot:CCG84534.1 protein of unknown function [Taphrina deformans PYCC 5710]
MDKIVLMTAMIAAVAAAPVEAQGHGNVVRYGTGGGILGFLVLLVDVYIFLELFKSSRPIERKILWALLVFFFPVIGFLAYFLLADRQKYNEYTAITDTPANGA